MKYTLVGHQADSTVFLTVEADSPEQAIAIAERSNPLAKLQIAANLSTTDVSYVPSFDGDTSEACVCYDQEYLDWDYEPELDKSTPRIVCKFSAIQDEQLDIFERKHADYGRDNILSGDAKDELNKREALMSLYVRMRDKLSRLKRLVDTGPAVKGESIRDTLIDLSNYATIGCIVHDGDWIDG